jgi:Holliday junction DNA helicase RuvA
MIGSLRGRIASKTPPQLTVDVGGLGYELEAPMSTFFHLPAVGEEVRLLTHLVVREDAHVLYAFATDEERRLFRSLIRVSGVGPKIALALLSGISVAAFAECVQREDIAALTRVPGVGRKTAERLIVEMRDRLVAPQPGSGTAAVAGAPRAESEAYDALVALGYRPAEATRLLKAVAPGTHSTEELIRRALQGAARESTP